MSPPDPPRASQSFVEKAGEAWVRMQDRTDTLIDPLGRVAIERLGLEELNIKIRNKLLSIYKILLRFFNIN